MPPDLSLAKSGAAGLNTRYLFNAGPAVRLHRIATIAVAPLYGTLTVGLSVCIVGLNAIVGIVFGWLFSQHSLEAAMIARGFAYAVAGSGYLVVLIV